MSLIGEIRSNILESAPISATLRRAKVLAYQLKNQDFKNWVDSELQGYSSKSITLPDYRKLGTQIYGDFMNSAWQVTGRQIPISIFPAEMELQTIQMRQGVKELEALLEGAKSHDTMKAELAVEITPYITSKIGGNMYCTRAWQVLTSAEIAQLLEDIRNRLLSFILELAERYPEAASADFGNGSPIPNEQIRQVFNYYIMGTGTNIVGSGQAINEGATMASFDQRGQVVNTQYNAAGDINFGAVQTPADIVAMLEQLQTMLAAATKDGEVENDAVIDAEASLKKAVAQAKKPKPDKKSIIERLNQAKAALEGVATSAKVVSAIAAAVPVVQKLLRG